jgi:hypothetical protein
MKCIFFFISLTLFSETIVLKNGTTVNGKVLGHDSESITISVDGESKNIPKNTVHKVIFSSNSVELNKIVREKRKISRAKKIKEEPSVPIIAEDEDLTTDDDNDEKKDIYQKLIILQQTQEKYEIKVKRLREKISRLKRKLGKKKSES